MEKSFQSPAPGCSRGGAHSVRLYWEKDRSVLPPPAFARVRHQSAKSPHRPPRSQTLLACLSLWMRLDAQSPLLPQVLYKTLSHGASPSEAPRSSVRAGREILTREAGRIAAWPLSSLGLATVHYGQTALNSPFVLGGKQTSHPDTKVHTAKQKISGFRSATSRSGCEQAEFNPTDEASAGLGRHAKNDRVQSLPRRRSVHPQCLEASLPAHGAASRCLRPVRLFLKRGL